MKKRLKSAWMFLLVILFGVGMIIAYCIVWPVQIQGCTEPVVGTVTSCEAYEVHDGESDRLYACFRFTIEYEVDGITHTCHSEGGSIGYKPGSEYDLLYNPSDPTKVISASQRCPAPILPLAGAVLTILGIYAVWPRKKQRAIVNVYFDEN